MNRLNVIALSTDEKSIVILDQTRLPMHEEYLTLQDEESMWKAIKLLQVRGAPAIGVFAGYAIAVLAGPNTCLDHAAFFYGRQSLLGFEASACKSRRKQLSY